MLTPHIIAWVEARLANAQATPPILAVSGAPPILAVSGAQGIGKSTAVAALAHHPRLRIATIGLDDVYRTKAARTRLARTVHPLCITRGPPGSHDLPLLHATLHALENARPSSRTPLPRFDKRTDDRTTPHIFEGRPDAILLEGWMLGALPDPAAPTSPPQNSLEAAEDPHGHWRAWQEAALAADYVPLWQQTAAMLHLEAPDWPIVEHWRLQQEATTQGLSISGLPLQNLPPERARWVSRFIMHFERITRRMLTGHRHPGDSIAVAADRSIISDSIRWSGREDSNLRPRKA